jgi:MFS family permease
MWGLSAVLAPMLGALFVEYLTWRWIFYVNIPIAILALVTLLPYKEVYTPKKTPIDYIGTILFIVSVSLLFLTTVVKTYQILYGVIGVFFLIVFILMERKQESPIIPLYLFQDKQLRWMNVNGFLGWVSLFGTASYIPLFLQKITHLSIFISGLALLGTAIGWMFSSVAAGKWIVKYGYRPLFIIGNAVLLCSGVFLFLLEREHGFWYVFFVMLIQGSAFGLLSTTGVIGAQQLVLENEKGVSTSFTLFIRNIGTAIGVTIMGIFLNLSDDFMAGIYHLFLYGLIGSAIALFTAFFVKDNVQPEVLKN